MSIGFDPATAAAGAGPVTSRTFKPKSLFSQLYGVVEAAQERLAAKLDMNKDGGVDLAELSALGGLGAGKNGPAAFAALDSDGDGKLNLRELQGAKIFTPEVLNTLLGQQSGNGLSEWLVAEGDADGDGALSLDEFRTVGPQGSSAPPRAPDDNPLSNALSKAERAFAAADADKDGLVTAPELAGVTTSYARRLWPMHNPAAVATSLMARDADGSGGLSEAELARSDAAAILRTVDADRNGEIGLDELRAEIERSPEYYSQGVIRLAGPMLAADGSPSKFTDFLQRRVVFNLPADGQAGLLRLFREQTARLADEMLAEARGATTIA